MADFIGNVNMYIECLKLKQSYLVMVTGIEKNKLSRVLSGKQEINSKDMDIIASALGHDAVFFMQRDIDLPLLSPTKESVVAFYLGEVDEGKKELADCMFKLLECADSVLGLDKMIKASIAEDIADGS